MGFESEDLNFFFFAEQIKNSLTTCSQLQMSESAFTKKTPHVCALLCAAMCCTYVKIPALKELSSKPKITHSPLQA